MNNPLVQKFIDETTQKVAKEFGIDAELVKVNITVPESVNKLTQAQAVQAIDMLQTTDPEKARSDALDILLKYLRGRNATTLVAAFEDFEQKLPW